MADSAKNDTVPHINCTWCKGREHIDAADYGMEKKFKSNFEFVAILTVSGLLILNFNTYLDRYSMVWWILTNVGFGFIGLGIILEYSRLNHKTGHKQ